MRRTEGRREFEFRTAWDVQRPEDEADPLKCVDFVFEEVSGTWMLEITDALKAPAEELRRATADLAGQLASGRLTKEMLMKAYGTHAHLALEGYQPGKEVYFAVIIGLPGKYVEAAQRGRVRNEIRRAIDRVGPSFHGRGNTPIVEVESIESWNARHPDVQIT